MVPTRARALPIDKVFFPRPPGCSPVHAPRQPVAFQACRFAVRAAAADVVLVSAQLRTPSTGCRTDTDRVPNIEAQRFRASGRRRSIR